VFAQTIDDSLLAHTCIPANVCYIFEDIGFERIQIANIPAIIDSDFAPGAANWLT